MTLQLVTPDWLPSLSKARMAHKYGHGHAMVMAGGPGQGGAARLAARAALRVGAGAVTVLAPSAALPENAARLDAIMLRACDRPQDLTAQLSDTRISAFCLGPALGLGDKQADMIAAVLAGDRRLPVVLDADAITHIARSESLRRHVHSDCVMTPHAGEFARLCPDIAARLIAPARQGPAYSKLDAARDAAKELGCTILLKGPDTIIATPTGQLALNAASYSRAAPWLATAGAGDVLAGLICGLLARGLAPYHAACWGAWLHVECARRFGPGLIAEDLTEMLPAVLAALMPPG